MKQKVKITWKAMIVAVLIVSMLITIFGLAGTGLFKFLTKNGTAITIGIISEEILHISL